MDKKLFISLFSDPQKVSFQQWQKDYALLPLWRKDKVDSYRFLLDKVLCTKAYLLLKEGLSTHYGIKENPDFIYTQNQKPLLKDYPHIHFNLSHCPRAVLCVIGETPIGCDIEQIQKISDIQILKDCFNDSEISQINSSPKPEIELTKLWTQKEAILKLNAEGIASQPLSSILTNCNKLPFSIVNEEKGFVYSVIATTNANDSGLSTA